MASSIVSATSRPLAPPADETGRAAGAKGVAPFLLITFGLSWSLWIGTWLATGRPEGSGAAPAMVAALFAGSFAPGLAAAILTLKEGRKAVFAWLVTFIRFRCGWRAYAVAALPLPLVVLALTGALGYTPRPGASHDMPAILFYLTLFPLSLINAFAAIFLGAGPLGEEGGWRGYLLPRLLTRTGDVRASLVIGVIWACWHLPIMLMFSDWRGGVSFGVSFPLYVVGLVCVSYVMTIVWRLGRGSLVPCIALHGLINALGGVAFNADLWRSGWTAEATRSHMAIAFAVVAAGLWLVTRARPGRTPM